MNRINRIEPVRKIKGFHSKQIVSNSLFQEEKYLFEIKMSDSEDDSSKSDEGTESDQQSDIEQEVEEEDNSDKTVNFSDLVSFSPSTCQKK